MRAEFLTSYPSAQVRAVHPEADASKPHARAVEMAESVREIAALGCGVTFRELLGAGYTSAEIIEHHEAADRIATERGTRQVSPDPDRLADMVMKARAPLPNKLPLPDGSHETQTLFVAWGRYCAARGAMLLDPWSGQRERCLDRLMAYLQKLPLYPRERKAIVAAVSETLRKVAP